MVPGVGVGQGQVSCDMNYKRRVKHSWEGQLESQPYVAGGEWLAEHSQSSSLYSPWSPWWYDSLPFSPAYQLPSTFKFTPGKSKKAPKLLWSPFADAGRLQLTPGIGARGSWRGEQLPAELRVCWALRGGGAWGELTSVFPLWRSAAQQLKTVSTWEFKSSAARDNF